MPWFLPAMAAGATIVLAKKLVARAWNEYFTQYATVDPPGFRTVARVTLAEDGAPTVDVLLGAIAAELARDLTGPLELARDAVRVEYPDTGPLDVVRIARVDSALTVELTRAWTGVPLGDGARRALALVDAALRHQSGVREVAWFAREDRRFGKPYATPCEAAAAATAR
jgi:hypothetical protein